MSRPPRPVLEVFKCSDAGTVGAVRKPRAREESAHTLRGAEAVRQRAPPPLFSILGVVRRRPPPRAGRTRRPSSLHPPRYPCIHPATHHSCRPPPPTTHRSAIRRPAAGPIVISVPFGTRVPARVQTPAVSRGWRPGYVAPRWCCNRRHGVCSCFRYREMTRLSRHSSAATRGMLEWLPRVYSRRHPSGNRGGDFLAGTVGGFAGKLFDYPFDTVKVLLQTQDVQGYQGPKYAVAYGALRHTVTTCCMRFVKGNPARYGVDGRKCRLVLVVRAKSLMSQHDTGNQLRTLAVRLALAGAELRRWFLAC